MVVSSWSSLSRHRWFYQHIAGRQDSLTQKYQNKVSVLYVTDTLFASVTDYDPGTQNTRHALDQNTEFTLLCIT